MRKRNLATVRSRRRERERASPAFERRLLKLPARSRQGQLPRTLHQSGGCHEPGDGPGEASGLVAVSLLVGLPLAIGDHRLQHSDFGGAEPQRGALCASPSGPRPRTRRMTMQAAVGTVAAKRSNASPSSAKLSSISGTPDPRQRDFARVAVFRQATPSDAPGHNRI